MTDPNAAALPDVRAALLQARSVLLALALHPDAFVAASPTHGQSVDPDLMRKHAETLRVLEAALRSREGERAEPADAPSCTNPICRCDEATAFREGQIIGAFDALADALDGETWPDDAYNAWQRLEGIVEALRSMHHRPAQPEEAAQRATPSAPTPEDEKRAALADPSGTQERND